LLKISVLLKNTLKDAECFKRNLNDVKILGRIKLLLKFFLAKLKYSAKQLQKQLGAKRKGRKKKDTRRRKVIRLFFEAKKNRFLLVVSSHHQVALQDVVMDIA